MNRTRWIIVLVGAGVVLAVLIGVLGTRNEPSKSEAASSLCTSLTTLESSVNALTSLDPNTATKSEYQADVTAVENDWDQVKSDAQSVQDAPTGQLDSAWDDFESAVKGIPDDASVSDALNSISQSAQQLVSTAKSTASAVQCS